MKYSQGINDYILVKQNKSAIVEMLQFSWLSDI